MRCHYHPDIVAKDICGVCGVSLCTECSQAIILGEYYCFQCAILIAKHESDTTLKKRGLVVVEGDKEIVIDRRPLNYFSFLAVLMILIMLMMVL